jgi:hypothetical protein
VIKNSSNGRPIEGIANQTYTYGCLITENKIVDVWDREAGEVLIGTITSVDHDSAWRWETKSIELAITVDGETRMIRVRAPNHENACGDHYFIIGGHTSFPVDCETIAPRRWIVGIIVNSIYGDLD